MIQANPNPTEGYPAAALSPVNLASPPSPPPPPRLQHPNFISPRFNPYILFPLFHGGLPQMQSSGGGGPAPPPPRPPAASSPPPQQPPPKKVLASRDMFFTIPLRSHDVHGKSVSAHQRSRSCHSSHLQHPRVERRPARFTHRSTHHSERLLPWRSRHDETHALCRVDHRVR